MNEITSILLIIVGCAVVGTVWYIRCRIRRFSKMIFGTEDIIEGFRREEELSEKRPKTVSSMTSLELPRIQRDFPEFHWPEWRQKCENQLKRYLKAVTQENIGALGAASAALTEQVRLRINDNQNAGIKETFDEVYIYQTEISRYEKNPGMCRILIETALEYHYTRIKAEEEAKENQKNRNKKEQCKYQMELVYIQDLSRLKQADAMFHMNCPNCGAPIYNLGNRHCEYCGTALEPLNTRVWMLNMIKKEQ